jgi:hypothetical protein
VAKKELGIVKHKLASVGGLFVRHHAIAMCIVLTASVLPVAAANRNAENWHDELSVKEVVSGRVVPFNGHESNISGDVIADKMGSKADAQALWGSQGGTVTKYIGCGECGVGSNITVVVEYKSVVDTHVFKRDK